MKFRVTRPLGCALVLLALAPCAAAQQSAAEEALAVARSGRTDSALVLLSRARSADPGNTDLRLAQARVMGWAGRKADAAALYDTLLATNPGNADAIVGLGYVYHWQGRQRAARHQADLALGLDSTNADALGLRRAIRAATRGTLESSANWSNDSDHNTNFWQSHSLAVPLTDAFRFLASGAVLQASDPLRNAWRYGGEAGLGWGGRRVQLSALGGARRLEPDGGVPRTAATYRGGLRWRPDDCLGIGIGYARYPFDETALLIGLALDVESLEGGLDAHLARGLLLTGGGGALWLSDGNRRTEGRAAITQTIGVHLEVGANGRALGYRERGLGYFSPDRFRLLEGTATIKTGARRGTRDWAEGSGRSRSAAGETPRPSGTWRRASGGDGEMETG